MQFKDLIPSERYDVLSEGLLSVSTTHKIHYITYGNKDGVPVVNVHGGPGRSMLIFVDVASYHASRVTVRCVMTTIPS